MKGEQYRPEGAAADVMDWLCNELPDISLFRPCSALLLPLLENRKSSWDQSVGWKTARNLPEQRLVEGAGRYDAHAAGPPSPYIARKITRVRRASLEPPRAAECRDSRSG